MPLDEVSRFYRLPFDRRNRNTDATPMASVKSSLPALSAMSAETIQ
jgi:hypothetical protein